MDEVVLSGQRLLVEVTGAGTPLLVVRNVAQPSALWPGRTTQLLVDAGYQVIAFEHHGSSDRIESIATDAAAVLDHVAPGPAHVWGYSQGAMTAQELVLQRPDLVRRGIFMATRGRLTAYDRHRYAIEQEIGGTRAGALVSMVMTFPPDMLCDDGLFETTLGIFAGSGPADDRGARAARAGAAYDGRVAALGDIRRPCMVIAFSHDVNIPPVLNREVADAIPGCRYVEIPGAAHGGGMTHAKEVLGQVLAFLAEDPDPQMPSSSR